MMTLGMKMRTMMEIKMMMMTMGFKIRTLMVTAVMLLRMMRMMMVRKSCQQAGNGRMKCERYGGQCFPTSTKASFQHLLAAASAWKKENMNLHRRHFYRHVAEIRSSVWRPGGPGHSVGRSQKLSGRRRGDKLRRLSISSQIHIVSNHHQRSVPPTHPLAHNMVAAALPYSNTCMQE